MTTDHPDAFIEELQSLDERRRCDCGLPVFHEGSHLVAPRPAWMRRMQDGKLPPKDLTGRAA